MIQKSIEE